MNSSSRIVSSNQSGIHDQLGNIVRRHLDSVFQAPIANHNRDAYLQIKESVIGQPLIFDSGCGNGRSTRLLAQQYPEALVIGIDKSAPRLQKHHSPAGIPDNYLLVRADLIDFWRLAKEDNIQLLKHSIYYPNPWPKKSHFQRRWHGSPLFPEIIALGGKLEVRSNWQIYIEEFSAALNLAGKKNYVNQLAVQTSDYISDFEEKYHRSGHTLWQLSCALNN